MELTPPSERRIRLLWARVPERFLDALEADDGSVVENWVLGQRQTYAALQGAEDVDWSAFEGAVVTPVHSESNDTVLLLATEEDKSRFVQVCLGGGPVIDHGPDFQVALARLLVGIWQLGELSDEDLAKLGEQLGLTAAQTLAEALSHEDPQGFDLVAFLFETVPSLLGS